MRMAALPAFHPSNPLSCSLMIPLLPNLTHLPHLAMETHLGHLYGIDLRAMGAASFSHSCQIRRVALIDTLLISTNGILN